MEAKQEPINPAVAALGALIRKRIEPGRVGNKVQLLSNSFPVSWNLRHLTRYNVQFNPDIPPTEGARRRAYLGNFHKQLNEAFGGLWVFDGITILATARIENRRFDNPNDRESYIFVNHIKDIDTTKIIGDSEVFTILNVIIKKYLRILKLVKMGRGYYNPAQMQIHGFDLTFFRGYSVALEPTVEGMSCNVDVIHRIVQNKSVRHLMDEIEAEVWAKYPNMPQDKIYQKIEQEVHKTLSGANVMTMYNKMVWRVDYVNWSMTANNKFTLKSGEEVSYAEYFSDRYKCHLSDIRDGVLVHIPKKKRRGQDNSEIVLIPEFCFLTGFTDAMRSNFRLMKAVSESTKLRPMDRFNNILGMIRQMSESKEIKEEMKPVPFTFKSDNCAFEARVLGPFQVVTNTRGRQSVSNQTDNFGPALKNCSMIQTPKLQKWVVVASNYDKGLVDTFVQGIMKCASMTNHSADVAKPIIRTFQGERPPNTEQAWKRHLVTVVQRDNPQMICCIMPEHPQSVYSQIKQTLTVDYPCLSQVILTKNLKNPKRVMPVCGGSLKQMLTKLGGIPWKVQTVSTSNFGSVPSMVVGVDVCHDKKHNRSTVGFCASYSADYCMYNSYITFQEQGQEIVSSSRALMERAIRAFIAVHGIPPMSILVYRDGVSESQFATVIRQEIAGYKAAFRSIDRNYNPNLTEVIVQKRVSARFFDARSGQSPPPGTVVDTKVVSPLFSDFYLVPCRAHPSQGTATPTRYVVVWDECNFKTDDLQQLTNQFCFLYFNWPGPIRVPAPCMYAHKIAFLVGKHIPKHEPDAKLNSKLFFL